MTRCWGEISPFPPPLARLDYSHVPGQRECLQRTACTVLRYLLECWKKAANDAHRNVRYSAPSIFSPLLQLGRVRLLVNLRTLISLVFVFSSALPSGKMTWSIEALQVHHSRQHGERHF